MGADDTRDELAISYVLGALDADEQALADASLAVDPTFRQAVAEANEAVDWLALAAPAVNPPAHLRERLFRQLTPVAAPRAIQPVQEPASWSQRLHATITQFIGGWGPALATAGVSLAVVFGFVTIASRQELSFERDSQARVAPQATAGAMVMSAVMSPRSTAVPLVTPTPSATPEMQAAMASPPHGRLLVDHDASRAVLVFRHLPPLPQRRSYQAWATGAGQQPLSLGTVRLTDNGVGILVTTLDAGADRLHDLMVTVEPEAGSDRPTMPAILTSSR